MPFTIDTDNLENDEFSLTENGSGDLVMEHKSTGATLGYNSTEDQWEPSGGIKAPTLGAGSINTDRVYSQTNQSTVVIYKEEDEVFASGRDSLIDSGADTATVIQNGIDHASEIGGGHVILLGEAYYNLQSPVTVRGGVELNTETNAFLQNGLSGGHTWPLQFEPQSESSYINFDAKGKQGILIGDTDEPNNMRFGVINSTGAGGNFDSTLSPSYQTNVEFRGFNISVSHINTFEGNRGISLQGCSDIYIDSLLCVNAVAGLQISSSEHVFISSADLDSSTRDGLVVSGNDIKINGTVWFNDNAYSASPRYGINIAEFSSASNLSINMDVLGATGDTAVQLGTVEKSNISTRITDGSGLFTAGLTPDVGINYTSNVGDGVYIDADIEGVTTKLNGTPAGSLNGVGYEAAGTGQTPTTANWTEHEIVENTDDNTLWWLDATATWRQII